MTFSPEELWAYEQIKRLVTRGKHGVSIADLAYYNEVNARILK